MQNRTLMRVILWACAAGSMTAQTGSVRQLYRQGNLRFEVPDAGSSKAILQNGNPKVDPALRALIYQAESKSLSSNGIASYAKSMDIPVSAEGVGVALVAASEDATSALARRVEDSGGEVVATFEDHVFARVPVSSVEKLAANRSVSYIASQGTFRATDDQDPDVSKGGVARGVALTGARRLHEKGITGKNIKIGILDFGFSRYSALQRDGKLPEPKAVKAFGKDGQWDRGETGVVHGTACAEIIHAMAPDASLYLGAVGDGNGSAGEDEIIAAGLWLIEQGVDLISFSGGGHMGSHRGNDIEDHLVEAATSKGILWVNAAGNEGQRHWMGESNRLNNDQLLLTADGKPYLEFRASGDSFILLVNWDDWGADPSRPSSNQDIDAYLFRIPQQGDPELVSRSDHPQAGQGPPIEVVGVEKGAAGQRYALFLHAKRVDRTFRVHVYDYLNATQMSPFNREGSIGIPATSRDALSVGAVNVDQVTLEPFSSAGPTDDNRAKPEVSGPDGDDSEAYRKKFFGTSAACPHVAGFAALLKQMAPNSNPAAIKAQVIHYSRRLTENQGAGEGIIVAPDSPSTTSSESASTTSSALVKAVTYQIESRIKEEQEDQTGIHPKVVVGRNEYQIGDGLKIGFKVEEDCYYLLLHRSAEGAYTLLAPLNDEDTRLTAGEKYTQPSGDKTIKITPPEGRENVILLCSRKRLRLETLKDADWDQIAVASVTYEVTQ